MVGTVRRDADLYATYLLDNSAGDISAQDVQDVCASKFSVYPQAVAAAGANQGAATAIADQLSIVTSGTGGVRIPAAIGMWRVVNALAVSINVYPGTGAGFDGFGTNIPVVVGPGGMVDIIMSSTTVGYAR